MKGISTKLKELREDRDLTQKEVAKATGIGNAVLSLYENGDRKPSYENLLILARFYDVSVDFLTGFEADVNVKPFDLGDMVKIPVLGSVPAGIPVEAIEDVIDMVDIPAKWVKGHQEYVGLLVTGDSMEPDYLAGDIVIVKITTDFNNGDDCVVYVNGYDATLKRVKRVAGNRIVLQPLNGKYKPMMYGPGDDPVKIFGVVVEMRRIIGNGVQCD